MKRLVPAAPAAGSSAAKAGDFFGVVMFFMGVGWLIDKALGTKPWFMVGLIVLGFVGHMLRTWYAYDADMRKHEQTIGKPS